MTRKKGAEWSRTKSGRWRKKRSDAGEPRLQMRRLYDVTCPQCETVTKFDLGVKGDVLRCPSYNFIIGGKTIVLEEGYPHEGRK